MDNSKGLVPIRCTNCSKKIGEEKINDWVVSIKCPKCGTLNVVEVKGQKGSQK